MKALLAILIIAVFGYIIYDNRQYGWEVKTWIYLVAAVLGYLAFVTIINFKK